MKQKKKMKKEDRDEKKYNNEFIQRSAQLGDGKLIHS